MTFWTWLNENKVKIAGVVSAVNSTIIGMAAAGQFNQLLPMATIQWLAIVGTIVGVAIMAAGYSNSTQVKVAEARTQVASAMQSAIESTPPPKV